MANQNPNRGPQTQSRGIQARQQGGRQNQLQNRQNQQGNPESFYSYSYGYGYYDPTLGEWVMDYYGPFYGKGPANYQRSDDRIGEDVNDLLWLDGRIDASDIDVDVNKGEVILKGTVQDRRMKRLAEDLAFSVAGVTDVQNQLRIQPQHNKQLGGSQPQTLSHGQNFKSQLKPGLEVVGSQGKKIGTIKEVHDNDILIDRSLAMDVHVPFSAIQNISGNQVHLSVTSDQIDNMHWATSPNKQTAPSR